MTDYENFSEYNDNLALFGIGVLNKIRDYIGFGKDAPNLKPINFRVRWLLTEPDRPDSDANLLLQIQYSVIDDNESVTSHLGYLSARNTELALEADEISHIETIASGYDAVHDF